MDRVTSYIKAGKLDEVRKALASKSISASTLRNWIRDREKALTAYRWSEFVDAIGGLPDLERAKRNQAYEFALSELGIDRDSQSELAAYKGFYRIFHDLTGVQLNHFVINVEKTPFVAAFAFKYRNKEDRQGMCDGLMLFRHGRLILAGFSPTTIFQAAFWQVLSPHRDVIRGIAFFGDLNTHEICFSNVALLRSTIADGNEREGAEEYVRSSGRAL